MPKEEVFPQHVDKRPLWRLSSTTVGSRWEPEI